MILKFPTHSTKATGIPSFCSWHSHRLCHHKYLLTGVWPFLTEPHQPAPWGTSTHPLSTKSQNSCLHEMGSPRQKAYSWHHYLFSALLILLSGPGKTYMTCGGISCFDFVVPELYIRVCQYLSYWYLLSISLGQYLSFFYNKWAIIWHRW